ncbi:hypothetical protein MTO96_014641 [Rhipicephalus appendiculatus]
MIQTSAFLPSSGLTEFYSTLVYGKLGTSVPRQNLCVRVVERTLSHLFLYGSFVELNLHTSAPKFFDIVIDIVKEFLRGIDASPYFNPASKAAIRKLVSKTRFKVLGPSWVKDNNAVERYVKNVPALQSQATAGRILDALRVRLCERDVGRSVSAMAPVRVLHTVPLRDQLPERLRAGAALQRQLAV